MAVDHPRVIVFNSGGTLTNEALYPYPCIVHGVHVAHDGTHAGWIQIHNSATVPAEGSVPLVTHDIPAKTSDANLGDLTARYYFDQGVYVCESDTVATKTLHDDGDCFFTIVIELNSTNA